jgi:hypothetical protein
MRDRLPQPGKEGRVKITQDNGQIVEGVLSYADDATVQGSVYSKGNVLPDSVCDALGIDRVTSEPKDALYQLWLRSYPPKGACKVVIRAYNLDGSPMVGATVTGIPESEILASDAVTDSNGILAVLLSGASYTLSIGSTSGYLDIGGDSVTINTVKGMLLNVRLHEKVLSSGLVEVKSTTAVKFKAVNTVDVFCVGGGAGGGKSSSSNGGGGGGGGNTSTANGLAVQLNTLYDVIIGAGGIGATSGAGGAGGKTQFGNLVTANGGAGGGDSSNRYGGNGGSGGGAAGTSDWPAGAGGSNGSNGGTSSAGTRGTGQGTTTRAFGEPTAELFAGGGGGGGPAGKSAPGGAGGGGAGRNDNTNTGGHGVANTGGGGGGGGAGSHGADGGSGIAIIRWGVSA